MGLASLLTQFSLQHKPLLQSLHLTLSVTMSNALARTHTHTHSLMGFLAEVWGAAPWLAPLDLNALGPNLKIHLEDP